LNSTRKKFGFQLIYSNAEVAGHLALSMVLARLLDPDDIGVYSMSAVLVAVAHIFRDFGVTAFIKRQKELSEETLRTALGVVMCTSWTMALLMYLSAPLWSSFFGEPRVENVVKVLALGFVLIPFGALPGAILVRNMEVVRTAKAGMIALCAYITVSIVLALKGFGHMTMAWASLTNIATHIVAVRLLSTTKTPWIPGLKHWGQVANFGAGAIITSAMTAIDNAIPDIFLGRLSTPANVGFFSKANSTINIASSGVMPAVNYFALPYMARLHHGQGDVAAEVCRVTSYLAALLLPAMAMTALLANEVIYVLYGAKWLPSAVAVPWLCISAGLGVLFSFVPSALMGIGKPYVAGLPMVLLLLLKGLFIAVLFDGTLQSFAEALVVAQVLTVPLALWIQYRYLGIAPMRWLSMAWPVVALTLLLLASMMALKWALPAMAPWMTVLVLGAPALIGWALLLRLFGLPLYEEMHTLFVRWRQRGTA
jgi:O-antigen/teichoic acid export membrane protein